MALALVAVGAALFATAFRESTSFVFVRVFHAPNVLVSFMRLPWWQRILLPVLGGLLAGLAADRARRAQGGQNVGDVMEALVLGRRPISIAASAWKALGSWFGIVCGASIGREGPLIQFGGALGWRLGASFRISDARTRALVAAGTAAGFAAAYNTPFAAVLFVLEVLTGVFALSIVLPVAVSAALATALTRWLSGPGPIYGEHTFTLRSDRELLLYLLLGVGSALVGVGFLKLLAFAEHRFARLPWPRPLRAALGGLIVGCIACALPEVTGNGFEAIALLLGGNLALPLVAIVLFAKPFATATSVGSGSPGGVFTPSLFLGAALGTLLATFVARIAPGAPIGAVGGYALVGMAAVIAATTHAPIMSAVMVFELSGDYGIVLPLLVATSVATALARKIEPVSIYMQELSRRGLRWEITLGGRQVERRELDEAD